MKITSTLATFLHQSAAYLDTGKAGNGAAARASNHQDSLTLSANARHMDSAVGAAGIPPEPDISRIAALKQAINAGDYVTDPARIASKLQQFIISQHQESNHDSI